jgi:hypothetical protein
MNGRNVSEGTNRKQKEVRRNTVKKTETLQMVIFQGQGEWEKR